MNQLNQQAEFPSWAYWTLRIAAVWNLLAGISMILFYHEGFSALGLEKTSFNLPIQLTGMAVGIFGIGYFLVSLNPIENRNLLLMGLLSKVIGPLLGLRYIVRGDLPMSALVLFFFADAVYWIPFWLIYWRAKKLSDFKAGLATPGTVKHKAVN
jgi:hypothetical protein